jgi:hypothetical protein
MVVAVPFAKLPRSIWRGVMILRDAIDHYVAWRRAHGARFITSARALYQFCNGVPEHVCCDAVRETEVR